LWSSVQEGIPLSLEQMMEFEMIDALCTKGMNNAEKLCQKMKMGAIKWSPELWLLVIALQHGFILSTPIKSTPPLKNRPHLSRTFPRAAS